VTTPDLSRLVVAMDGTAGSGKSSASRGVAARLGLRYLDTGAMYRAMTWQMLLDGVDVDDPDAVAARAETVVIGSGTNPELPTISLDGADVSVEIRSDATTRAVSPVSAVPRVREILVAQQREVIDGGGIVVEGRDIGTVVAPDAALKIYLTADPSARALRRSAEMAPGQVREVAAVEADLVRRDAYDSGRATAPLSAAADAVALDTTHLTLDQVIDEIVALALERAAAQG
jgi:cytidylate kinase